MIMHLYETHLPVQSICFCMGIGAVNQSFSSSSSCSIRGV